MFGAERIRDALRARAICVRTRRLVSLLTVLVLLSPATPLVAQNLERQSLVEARRQKAELRRQQREEDEEERRAARSRLQSRRRAGDDLEVEVADELDDDRAEDLGDDSDETLELD